MGVIEIDPVQLLEDGLRSGIARRISAALVTHSQASDPRQRTVLADELIRHPWLPDYCTLTSAFPGGSGD